jgi:tRNA threonylcarbamoyladenosine biosynthesis protein TsaB
MRVLGFDTATSATAVGLLELATDGHELVAIERRDDPPPGTRPRHTGALLALAIEALDEAGIGWDELDLLAVGTGPGTFTGLRIGIATAHALARAREIPLVGVSTLESLALGAARTSSPEAVAAVIDARRGEVFAAAWTVCGGERAQLGGPLLAPAAIAPDALALELERAGESVVAVGDGAVEFRTQLERSGVQIPGDTSDVHRVTAISHCELGQELHAGAPEDVVPSYLRLPDAEISRRRS